MFRQNVFILWKDLISLIISCTSNYILCVLFIWKNCYVHYKNLIIKLYYKLFRIIIEKWGSKYMGKLFLIVLLLNISAVKWWFVFKTSYTFYSSYLVSKWTPISGSIHLYLELRVYTTFSKKGTYFLTDFVIKNFLYIAHMKKTCKYRILGLNTVISIKPQYFHDCI